MGGFEAMVFGFAVFVVGLLVVAYSWAVLDTKTATTEAARQAARTYVEAPDAATAEGDAQQAALSALAGYGRNPARATVTWSGGGFARCALVTVVVSYPAPLLELPIVGGLGRGMMVHSQHSELVDPFRAGLPGASSCP